MPDYPYRAGEPGGLRSLIELAEVCPRARRRGACAGIDRDALDRPQVEDHSAVTGGESGGAVPAAAHGNGQLVLACEPERGGNVGHAGALRDAGWVPVEDRVPHHPGLVIVRVAGQHHPAAELSGEGSKCRAVKVKVSFHYTASPS